MGIDRHAQQQLVQGRAGRTQARSKRRIARLDIGNLGVNIPQAIFARVSVDLYGAPVLEHARGCRLGQGHSWPVP